MAQDISKESVRLLLSEILKILATSEYQTQLEKTRQTSANDAVALLQNVIETFFTIRKGSFFVIFDLFQESYPGIFGDSHPIPGKSIPIPENLYSRDFF